MTIEFQQKKGLNVRKFTLSSDKITIETKTIRKISRYDVKLDNVGLDTHYQADNTIVGKIFVVVCFALVIGSTVGIFVSQGRESVNYIINAALFLLLACFGYFKQHQDDIYLVGGQTNLVFFRNVPNEKIVLEFIEQVKQQVKDYLIEKYAFWDNSTLEQDYYNCLNWLLHRGVISHNQYAEYIDNFETQKLL